MYAAEHSDLIGKIISQAQAWNNFINKICSFRTAIEIFTFGFNILIANTRWNAWKRSIRW